MAQEAAAQPPPECLVCTNVMLPPVLKCQQCRAWVCLPCWERLPAQKPCPQCRRGLQPYVTWVHDAVAEVALWADTAARYPCPHAPIRAGAAGCPEQQLTYAQLVLHLAMDQCAYRPEEPLPFESLAAGGIPDQPRGPPQGIPDVAFVPYTPMGGSNVPRHTRWTSTQSQEAMRQPIRVAQARAQQPTTVPSPGAPGWSVPMQAELAARLMFPPRVVECPYEEEEPVRVRTEEFIQPNPATFRLNRNAAAGDLVADAFNVVRGADFWDAAPADGEGEREEEEEEERTLPI